jgi:hypothetical protein
MIEITEDRSISSGKDSGLGFKKSNACLALGPSPNEQDTAQCTVQPNNRAKHDPPRTAPPSMNVLSFSKKINECFKS